MTIDALAIPEKAKTPTKRFRAFVGDVVALCVLAGGAATALCFAAAVWCRNDVSDVGGWRLRLAALTFFFRVFQYHIGGLVLLGAALAWLVRHRRVAAFTFALALLMLLPLLRASFPKSPPAVSERTLKIYSANLFAENRDGASILRSIHAENPDVIVLMEVTSWSYAMLFNEFGEQYRYIHRPMYNGGGMVMSRVPFREEAPVTRLRGNHTRVPLVFTIDGLAFCMYPVHLLSPGRLSLIADNRAQVREFLQIDGNDTRPMLIVGDCNMTPLTSNFGALRNAGFRSTNELAGFGACNTWGPRWWPSLNRLPGIQIDQMLLQPPLTAKSHHVGLDTGSDHRPIVAEVGFEK